MKKLDAENVGRIKAEYAPGTRVVLNEIKDPYAQDMKSGLAGTVAAVDDTGTVHVRWDTGRTLGLIPGVDSFHKA